MVRVGVISDTHGLLRPEALAALAGVDRILHAGDVGDVEILRQLEKLAPVRAIRGNIDTHGPCAALPAIEYITIEDQIVHMLHDESALDLNPASASIAAVVFGHSHKPLMEHRRGVLFFNPGSAGPRRFSLPVTLGILEVSAESMQAHLVTLI